MIRIPIIVCSLLIAGSAIAGNLTNDPGRTASPGGAGGTGGQGGQGGQGGTGGSGGTQTQRQSSSSQGGSVVFSGGSGSGTRAPDINLPSWGGGGMDCPTVGFGAGGSGLGGGGGFGPSWISSDCNKRKVAEMALRLYGPAVARAYAEKNIEGIAAAVAATGPPQKPDWCLTSSGIELTNHSECLP